MSKHPEQQYPDLDLWKPEQVAEKFQMAKSTVYHLAAKGILPAVKVGGKIRFRPSTLLKYFEDQEKTNYGTAA